ncbi:hypothetical protein ACGFS9_30680 [Streptomyces sp. NPDC048566]|uniref:hypothetical protein n=1 Tax=Streptomyces sp. NPDC048566 TaxID=3365569 RepID=UPI0037216182
MRKNRSISASRSRHRERARRWKHSKLWLALIGGPVILAVVAGSVFAAGGHHRSFPGRRRASTPPAPTGEPNPDCTLLVPRKPLSARGLATPYELVATDPAKGPCHEANADQAAFVEAAVLTEDGDISIYHPLVIDKGRRPATRPARATVPKGSTVGIWFGFNNARLTLRASGHSHGLHEGRCVNGVKGSVFGQFAYCNAPAFFRAAHDQAARKKLGIPALGTAKDGLPCPTTRAFSVVDQDGSDNVVTHYLADAHGRIAQNNAAGRAALSGTGRVANRGDRRHRHDGRPRSAKVSSPVDLANGSDNLLLTQFIDPALGCRPFTAPDQSGDGRATSALALDELSAAAGQKSPIALIPRTDPMALIDGRLSTEKTDAYRVGVGMPAITGDGDGDGATYCRTLFGDPAGIRRVFDDRAIFESAPSPDPGTAPNLYAFLAARASQTFTDLGCERLLGLPDPVTLTRNGDGLVVDAVLAPLGTTRATPTPADGAPTATPADTDPHTADGVPAAPNSSGSASPGGTATPSRRG